MKLIPKSIAARTARVPSFSSTAPWVPPSGAAPKPSTDTFHPVLPKTRYFIVAVSLMAFALVNDLEDETNRFGTHLRRKINTHALVIGGRGVEFRKFPCGGGGGAQTENDRMIVFALLAAGFDECLIIVDAVGFGVELGRHERGEPGEFTGAEV